MKRKLLETSQDRAYKRPKTSNEPNILDPLLKTNLLRLSQKYTPKSIPKEDTQSKIQKDPRYTEFAKKLKPSLLEEEGGDKKLQLSNFIINNLARKDIPGSSGNLDYVQLLNDPYETSSGNRMDFYSGYLGPKKDKQGIVMSPYKSEQNPITTLMHEGTHALDDFLMRTYQKEAIDTLAGEEKKGDIGHEGEGLDKLKSLYEGAQNILGSRDFSDRYNFKDAYKKSIKGSFKDLSEIDDDKPQVANFVDAQRALNNIRNRPENENSPPSNAFLEFSEFPAFAMERLFNPWNINAQTNPQSKEFLGNIMTGVRRNFKQLGLQNPGYKEFKYTDPKGINQMKIDNPNGYKTTPNLYTDKYNQMKNSIPNSIPNELAKKRSNYPDVYQAFKDRKAQFGPLISQMGVQNYNNANNSSTTTTTNPNIGNNSSNNQNPLISGMQQYSSQNIGYPNVNSNYGTQNMGNYSNNNPMIQTNMDRQPIYTPLAGNEYKESNTAINSVNYPINWYKN